MSDRPPDSPRSGERHPLGQPHRLPDLPLLPFEDALDRILALAPPSGTMEDLALPDALGRVLAEAVVAARPLPAFRNSAVDGYAIRGADLAAAAEGVAFRLVGQARAGAPFGGPVGAGECVRILTGAALPEDADTVVMQEDVRVEGEGVFVAARVLRQGAHVRGIGEDLAAGDSVLEPGLRLAPAHLAAAAAAGRAALRVHRRPRVAYFSTGDELRPLGQALAFGEIHDSNGPTLGALLARLPVEPLDLGIVPDRPEAVRAAFEQAAAEAEAVLTTGGVSVGDTDYVQPTIEALGELAFWRVAVKPGKPLAVGRVGRALLFGLPGNPVSALVTFYQLVQPALRRLAGEREVLPLSLPARAETALPHEPGRLEFQRGILSSGADGALLVRSAGAQGSHVLGAMARANCFILLAAERGDVAPGETVRVQPFAGLV